MPSVSLDDDYFFHVSPRSACLIDVVRGDRDGHRYAYTARIHAHQLCKGTTIPYLSHLMNVSALVLEHGGDEELAIAGLLHDAIEDIGLEQEPIILENYGARVAHVVRTCTDADTLPKPP